MAYVVCAKWTARAGTVGRVAEICEEMGGPSRAEAEQYVDEAAYEAHMISEHLTKLVADEAIPELLASREREFDVTP